MVGLNYRGLGLFDENNQCYISYPYLEIDDVTVTKTRLHITLCNGEHLWFQADIAAAQEIGAGQYDIHLFWSEIHHFRPILD